MEPKPSECWSPLEVEPFCILVELNLQNLQPVTFELNCSASLTSPQMCYESLLSLHMHSTLSGTLVQERPCYPS